MNWCEPEPPISPDSASTMTYSRPQRLNILQYVSYILQYVFIEAFGVGVEAVGVFHNKFAAAQDAEARAEFVAELEADLIEIYRKLFVGFDFACGDAGNDFFGCRRKDIFPAVAVLEFAIVWP